MSCPPGCSLTSCTAEVSGVERSPGLDCWEVRLQGRGAAVPTEGSPAQPGAWHLGAPPGHIGHCYFTDVTAQGRVWGEDGSHAEKSVRLGKSRSQGRHEAWAQQPEHPAGRP